MYTSLCVQSMKVLRFVYSLAVNTCTIIYEGMFAHYGIYRMEVEGGVEEKEGRIDLLKGVMTFFAHFLFFRFMVIFYFFSFLLIFYFFQKFYRHFPFLWK
jgi:hypothetical protein